LKKSALFYGVSSGALLASFAGSVLADDLAVGTANVTTTLTTQLFTSKASNNSPGNITIGAGSTVTIGTSGAAVTIDSSNFVDSSGLIQSTAASGGIGVELKGGFTGDFTARGISGAIVNVVGSGAGDYGLLLSGNTTFTGNITFEVGSQILVYGTSPTAIAINAPLSGNLTVGATTQGVGQGATGVLVTQPIDGMFTLDGALAVAGTAAFTVDKVDPLSGSGIAIGANITQGFLIAGSIGDADSPAAGLVTNSSDLPAVIIAPSIGGNVSGITIGALVNDPGKIDFSVINRGTVHATENDTGISTIGMRIGDITSGANSVTLTNGFYNRGSINADSASDNSRSTSVTATATNALGLEIGNTTTLHSFAAPTQTVGSPWITPTEADSGPSTAILGNHASSVPGAYTGLLVTNDATGETRRITDYTVSAPQQVGNVTTTVKTLTVDTPWTLAPKAGNQLTIKGDPTNTVILAPGADASKISGAYNGLTITAEGQTDQFLVTGYRVITDPTITDVNVDPTTLRVATIGAAKPGSPSTWAGSGPTAGNVTITGRALVNDGHIGASTVGTAGGVATALLIHEGGNVSSLTNNGFIQASALSSNLTISNLSAIGIQDLSGTLGEIYNTRSITAAASVLNDNSQIVTALDLKYRTGPETIYVLNHGVVAGAIKLGAGDNTIIIEGGGTTAAGPYYATVASDISSAMIGNQTGTVDIHISDYQTGGILSTSNTTARNITVGEGGNVQFALTKNSVNTPLITAQNVSFNTSAAATAPARFQLTPTTFLPVSGNYTLINAGTGSVHFDNFAAAAGLADSGNPFPFLVNGSFSGTDANGAVPLGEATTIADLRTLQVNIQRKSAAELGLQGPSAAIFEPFSEAALHDDQYGAALLQLTSAAEVQSAVAATLPDIAGGVRALTIAMTDQATGVIGSRQRALLTAPKDTRTDFRFWGQEFYNVVADHGATGQPGYGGGGLGVAIGGEWGSLQTGRYGVGYTFFSSQETERHPRDTKTNGDWNMLSAYAAWKFGDFFVAPQINGGMGDFLTRREITVGNVIARTPRASFSGYIGAGGVTSGYIIDIGKFQLIPTIALDGMYLTQSGYDEVGGGGMGLTLKSQALKSVRTFAGLIGQGNYAYSEGAFMPQVLAGWSHEFINDPVTIDGSFESTPGSPIHIVGPTLDANKIVGGMSFGYVLRNWSAGFNYDASASSGTLAQSATISLTSRF